MTLAELKINESCEIISVGGEGALRQHFLDMGLIPGAKAKLVKFAPMGDPMELLIHGYELTLRLDDAKKIEIKKISDIESENGNIKSPNKQIPHPGLGEGGKFHNKKEEHPLPDMKCLLLPWRVTRTVARQLCLTGLQEPISMWAISRV